MKKRKGSGIRIKVALLLLLALLCIGTVELIACYFFAPALFQKITAPVVRAAVTVSQTVSHAAVQAATHTRNAFSRASDAVSDLLERLNQPEPEPEPVTQLAGDPAILREATTINPLITELQPTDEGDILTGGIVPIVYFNQGQPPWADLPYGRDSIGGYGCGPTSMAMAVSSLTEQSCDPAQMATWSVEHGHWASRNGSYLSLIPAAAQAHGLTATPIRALTAEAIQEELLSGHLIVALMGPGHFTQGGHFILLRGITLSGSILVADPNSTERSLMEWDAQLLVDELSQSRHNGAPLWVLRAT